MFTAEQIKVAHSKVKSGADFPSYIQEIKSLGVCGYETYVTDGRTNYQGFNDYTLNIPAKYDPLHIANNANKEGFTKELREHQQGRTDFITFVTQCASLGIEKWVISMKQMTCTYYDTQGNEVLTEQIPG